MPQKILIIDDDLFIREIYDEVIRNAGFETDLAVNGQEGVKKLQNGGYAIVLLDLNMPGMDGLQVLDEVQKNPPVLKNGPIVILSNSADNSALQDALQKGATSYLLKSDLNPDQLLENIKKVMGGK